MPDLYDTLYPGEVAGHVEAGAFMDAVDDPMVNTTRGPDVFFNGDDITEVEHAANPSNAGVTAVNRRIGETVKQARERDRDRTPTVETASTWNPGSMALRDGSATRLLIVSPNRKCVTITNQSAAAVSVGRESGITLLAPNTVSIPAGGNRVFTHASEVWVVGAAGAVIDWSEENY